MTFELEFLYERDVSTGVVSEGVNSINPGVRVPFYQYVSAPVDTTFGVGTEVAVPINSARSSNTEVVPKIFNDLILGDHFTLQSIFGYSGPVWPRSRSQLATLRVRICFRIHIST